MESSLHQATNFSLGHCTNRIEITEEKHLIFEVDVINILTLFKGDNCGYTNIVVKYCVTLKFGNSLFTVRPSNVKSFIESLLLWFENELSFSNTDI